MVKPEFWSRPGVIARVELLHRRVQEWCDRLGIHLVEIGEIHIGDYRMGPGYDVKAYMGEFTVEASPLGTNFYVQLISGQDDIRVTTYHMGALALETLADFARSQESITAYNNRQSFHG